MIYTKYYGADVAGLVFVDASHPDQARQLAAVTSQNVAQSTRPYRVASALAWAGVVRDLPGSPGAAGEPESASRATAAYASKSLDAMLDESAAIDSTLAEAGTFRRLGDRPLVVLTAGAEPPAAELRSMKLTDAQWRRRTAVWNALQDDEATWSSRSEHRVVPDAGHYIQCERPDVVIAAVRKVVEQTRR
jgi:pimeloyl-ACP methyl ester carboxylesterase